MVSTVKDPEYIERAREFGRVGAEKRWANPAVRTSVRIDSLTNEERAVVLALIDAKKGATSTKVTPQEVSGASTTESTASRS